MPDPFDVGWNPQGAALSTDQRISDLACTENDQVGLDGALALFDDLIAYEVSNRSTTLEDVEVIEIDVDDLFELIALVMGLSDPAARRIGLSSLAKNLAADDIEYFSLGCFAVKRFCCSADVRTPSGN